MKILSDIIMHGFTSSDIILHNLARYQDMTSADFAELCLRLKTGATVVPQVIFIGRQGEGYDSFRLKSSVTDNIHSSIKIYPMICKLVNIDDILLHELDPLLLSEMDYSLGGTRLVSGVSKIQNDVYIKDKSEQSAHLKLSSPDVSTMALLRGYDEYLVMHFDKYTLDDMDKKNIL